MPVLSVADLVMNCTLFLDSHIQEQVLVLVDCFWGHDAHAPMQVRHYVEQLARARGQSSLAPLPRYPWSMTGEGAPEQLRGRGLLSEGSGR